MRVCSYCATLAFLLGVLLVLYIWPVFNRGLQSGGSPSYNAGYAGSGGYNGGGVPWKRRWMGYGGDGGYGGGTVETWQNGAWGQSSYAIYPPIALGRG